MANFSMETAHQELVQRATAMRSLSGSVPGKEEANTQAKVLANGAERALRGRGRYRVQLNTSSTNEATVKIAGNGVNRLVPGLLRQRDHGAQMISNAIESDIKKLVNP